MNKAVLFFSLMPYIGISYLPTDIQPVFIVFGTVALLLSMIRSQLARVNYVVLAIVFLCFISILTFLIQSLSRGYVEFYDLRALFGYVTPVVVLGYLYGFNKVEPKEFVFVLDLALFFVALGFVLNLIGLTALIQIFVSRAEVEGLGANRGLTSFFPEQSRVSTQMMLFGLLYLMLGALNHLRLVLLLLFSLLSASGQVFVNLAFLSGIVAISYFIAARRFNSLRVGFLFLAAGFIAIASAVLYMAAENADYLIAMGMPRRGVLAISGISNAGMAFIGQDLGILYKLSGFLQGVTTIFVYPITFQVGSAYYLADDVIFSDVYLELAHYLFGANAVPFPRRSFSIFGGWLTDFGVVGLLLFVSIFCSLWRTSLRLNNFRLYFISLLVWFGLLFLFLFRSNSSDPTFWVVLAVYLFFLNRSIFALEDKNNE